MRLRTAAALALAALAAVPAAAGAADVPKDATWTQATFPSTDGVTLHADVLRPKGLKDTDKTPVILSIGPYFSRSGQTGPDDPIGPSTGPSDRFADFTSGAKLFERGYTFVMVDLRGFGGSTGCLDWGGPGEQSDVVEAVKWAAKQPWSTGSVGMYGKSYDAVTGLVGVDYSPPGLKAVVAQEPVYDLYRYLYGDGIKRANFAGTPAAYTEIAYMPGAPVGDAPDDPTYLANSMNDTSRPGCAPLNLLDQAGNDDHYSPYWRARDLIPRAKGSQVPLFLTQGLTEQNTVADGTAQYLRNHTGPEHVWLGPWDHVRGAEMQGNKLKMGRKGWYDEVMRFYDQYLKGQKPAVKDPPIAVQTNDGKWREEAVWPPVDSTGYTSELKTGTYGDTDSSAATGSGAENGLWTISKPLPYDAHLSGSGRVSVDVSCPAPNCNLVADVYDLDSTGKGPLITRQAHLIRRNGTIGMDLWSADWKLKAGHRIGVKIADANDDWWLHVPTQQTVTVYGGSVTLPFLSTKRTSVIQGDPGTMLAGYLAEKVTVPADTIKNGESPDFALPPAMKSR